MKKLSICLLIIFSLITLPVYAEDWSGSVSVYKTIPSDPENIVQSGQGFQINLHHKSLYLYGSKDINPIRFGGQSGIDVNVYSAGIGFQNQINDNFSFFADIGWYEPKHDDGAHCPWTTTFGEGLFIYMNDKLIGTTWQTRWRHYKVEYSGSIGGKLGVAYQQGIFRNTMFKASVGYRYLQLREKLEGWNDDRSRGWWEFHQERDFGGWIINAAIVVEF